jgi:hypothetical protein
MSLNFFLLTFFRFNIILFLLLKNTIQEIQIIISYKKELYKQFEFNILGRTKSPRKPLLFLVYKDVSQDSC